VFFVFSIVRVAFVVGGLVDPHAVLPGCAARSRDFAIVETG
jgi:hypothetical protein